MPLPLSKVLTAKARSYIHTDNLASAEAIEPTLPQQADNNRDDGPGFEPRPRMGYTARRLLPLREISVLQHLLCPLDRQPLSLTEQGLCCPAGHSYDRAKSGYVNLLPVQNKRSKDPGDSKAMVAARRTFLDQGHYTPIAAAVAAGLANWLPAPASPNAPLRVLDAGCGEGYYLIQLQLALAERGQANDCLGLDISKWAVQAASKRSHAIDWVVGSNASLPAPEGLCDLVLCLFGFPVATEFARVLKPGGVLLLADAGADHLIELRRILYPEIHPYTDSRAEGLAGFQPLHEEALAFRFDLTEASAIQALLAMTPHLHKASYAGRQAAAQLQRIALTADVRLRWYRRC